MAVNPNSKGAALLIRLPQDLLDAFDAAAFKNNTTRSEAIRSLMHQYTTANGHALRVRPHGNKVYDTVAARERAQREAAKRYKEKVRNNG